MADNFPVDRRTASQRVREPFKRTDGPTLGHHDPVAVNIKRTARLGWIRV